MCGCFLENNSGHWLVLMLIDPNDSTTVLVSSLAVFGQNNGDAQLLSVTYCWILVGEVGIEGCVVVFWLWGMYGLNFIQDGKSSWMFDFGLEQDHV